jgi:CHASE2 domain-containing sensor protein
MINLLSAQYKKLFKRMYTVRLLTVSLFVAAALILIHGVLFVPTYVFLQTRVLTQTVEKELISRTLEASGSGEVEKRLAELHQKITLLETLPAAPSFVSAVEEVLEVSRIGIKLTQFSYEPKSAEAQIALRGVAVDRDALRGFAKRLEDRPEVASVAFPIGDLSKEKDLPFTISIELAP